jgi:hypothetical protein
LYFHPVQANRVIRENAHHSVLVGEREMHSGDTSYINSETKAISRSIPVIIGWIIAVLAVAFIGYYLYKNNFHPFSSGTKQLISITSLHSQVT